MKIKLKFIIVLLVFSLSVPCVAQNAYHELGFGVGPMSFRGDWGEREDTKTNFGNTGFGINLLHFVNFAYGRNTFSYFNQHFKVRNQIGIHYTNLNHYGRWVDGESAPFLLANMSGQTTVFELGSGVEWNWRAIRSYERQVRVVQPIAGFGANIVFFNPNVETSLPGEIGSPENTWPTFLPAPGEEDPISNSPDATLSLNFQAGMRYRLNKSTDVFLEGRWHYYLSDFMDGLSPINPNNNSSDWIFALNFGMSFYLD